LSSNDPIAAPPTARLPASLAAAIDQAMSRIRSLVAGGAPDRETLAAVGQALTGAAADRDAFDLERFPMNPATRDAIYLLSEDPDQRLALYLAVRDVALRTPVHDHDTWACIVGVHGRERNWLYERAGDGALQAAGQADVVHGTGVGLLASDLHRIATDAGALNMQLHLYGRSFDAQTARIMVDEATGAVRPFAGHPDIRVPAGRLTAAMLRRMTRDGGELAVIDVRDVATHAGQGHPVVATCLPIDRLESALARCCPNPAARIALIDEGSAGDRRADDAAERLTAAGYSRVHPLAGGVRAWRQAGYPLFTGINVPSKAFGEFIEHRRGTPRIDAASLKARLDRGERLLLLDCRTPAEHHRMTIAGSLSMPGTEAVARIRALVPDPAVPVIVHCAGRTRGIVATQSLIDAGLPNPVAALENGLIGWLLAGFPLEFRGGRPMPDVHGALPGPPPVTTIGAGTLDGWLADATRTTYLFDVRTAAEYAAGHHPAARHAPGGELLQQTDAYVPVRRSRVVITGDDARARSVAAWLARMDWCDVALLGGDFRLTRDGAAAADPAGDGPAQPRGWQPPFDERKQDPVRMRAYIDWELGLMDQIIGDSTLAFGVHP